jgi:hypothetical protein
MVRPGIRSNEVTPREYLLDNEHVIRTTVVIASTARDGYGTDGSTPRTPTTQLRRGLVLGKITVGGKFAQYDDDAGDGTEVADCILDEDINLLDADGTAQDTPANVVIHAAVVESELLAGVAAHLAAAKVDLVGRIIFR